MNDENVVPRRNDLSRNTPEELEFNKLIDSIEFMGADTRLTNCVNSLLEAKNHLSDYIDNVNS